MHASRKTLFTMTGLLAALTTAAVLVAAPGSNAPTEGGNAPPPGKRGDVAVGKRTPAKAAKIGEPAPAFTLKGVDGKEYKLSDYAGKTVVLEWFNPECPVVVRQHTDGDLKTLGNEIAKGGTAVWLAVNSGAAGSEGSGLEKNQQGQKRFAMEYPVLLDESGDVGHAYGARNTPHMFVISKTGTLVYAGAIDNNPSGKPKEGEEHVNYVRQALKQIAAGESVSPSETQAYGCTVKYGKAKTN